MNKKKYLKWTLILLVIYGLIMGGYKLYTGGFFGGPKQYNVLVLGTDGGNTRTDVMLVAQFDVPEKKLRFLSIPRDTRVVIGKNAQKINSAYAIGGLELTQKTVTELTGLELTHYITVDFDGFVEIIDLLGGVDFDVPQDMKYSDPVQDLYINLKKGPQHLDGDKSEQLVRFRMYPLGDLQRVAVQQDFLKALVEQKLTPSNLLKAGDLMDAVKEYADTDLTSGDIMRLVPTLTGFDTETIETYQLPGAPETRSGISYYICNERETRALIEAHFLPGDSSEEAE